MFGVHSRAENLHRNSLRLWHPPTSWIGFLPCRAAPHVRPATLRGSVVREGRLPVCVPEAEAAGRFHALWPTSDIAFADATKQSEKEQCFLICINKPPREMTGGTLPPIHSILPLK
ncbi:hypothetical protein O3P69_007947 [Scylla paramamosain]|uniref:Uncharacterized protein n=1 Tax=Scylla paramamosain TaxID=85552 RepID=A0AAW0SYZ6_SCYPA